MTLCETRTFKLRVSSLFFAHQSALFLASKNRPTVGYIFSSAEFCSAVSRKITPLPFPPEKFLAPPPSIPVRLVSIAPPGHLAQEDEDGPDSSPTQFRATLWENWGARQGWVKAVKAAKTVGTLALGFLTLVETAYLFGIGKVKPSPS